MSEQINNIIANLPPSGIRKFFDIAAEMDDVISLSIGEPDFNTPFHIREAGIRSLEQGKTFYSANRGFTALRESIKKWVLRKYGIEYDVASEILVTVGGSEAIDLCFRCLLNQGDEVLIPEPSYVAYSPLAKMAGANVKIINTKAENSFRLTAKEIEEAVTDKTKMLVLPYPNNPTGAVMRLEHLKEIAPVIIKHDLLVLSDEIYAELTYGENQHISIASLDGLKERTIMVNGFSKAFAMTGWRLGFACAPSKYLSPMTKLHQYAIMCSPTLAQYAAMEALEHGDSDISHMKEQYDLRRRYIVNTLNDMGLTCFEPEGAFYVFPSIKSTGLSSEEFCSKLLKEEKVAVVPGSAFGQSGEGFIRVSYSYSLKHIEEAMNRIKRFIK